MKLQKEEEPAKKEKPKETAESLTSELTKCVHETIEEIVPPRKLFKKNGRVVGAESSKSAQQNSENKSRQKREDRNGTG